MNYDSIELHKANLVGVEVQYYPGGGYPAGQLAQTGYHPGTPGGVMSPVIPAVTKLHM